MPYCRLFALLFLVASFPGVRAAVATAPTSSYSIDTNFDLHKIPFSRYGSYLDFKDLPAAGKVVPPGGVFLRTMHGGVTFRELFRVEVLENGTSVPFEEIASPTLLTLKSAHGSVEIFFAGANRIRFRTQHVAVRFATPYAPGSLLDAFAEPVDKRDASAKVWDYNASFEEDLMLRWRSEQGKVAVLNTWDGRTSDQVAFTFSPSAQGGAEGQIEEFGSSYHPDGPGPYTVPAYIRAAQEVQFKTREQTVLPSGEKSAASFEEELESLRREYAVWLEKMPTVPAPMQKTADLAAYVDWSAVVEPQGFYTRPAMLMSKSNMANLWSWDNCFNSMALAGAHPDLAWDQFMWVFDSANQDGISADYENDRSFVWNFYKIPIQGLTLAYMQQQNPAYFNDAARLRDLYPKLAKRTEWYLRFRDWDRDGLPQYNHGNDSGWDNATIFLTLPPLETPDLAAFLVLQMEELSDIARKLGKVQDAERWRVQAEQLRAKLVAKFWDGDHFVALHDGDHKKVEAESLILYLPLILGSQLPEQVRGAMLKTLQEPGLYLTDHGLATEALHSAQYTKDGYWRGPIWAPSTMLMAEGIEAAGDHRFAEELKRRFCEMVMRSGFSENFDPVTGEPFRDSSYTWTSSVFLIFAHELQTGTSASFVAHHP